MKVANEIQDGKMRQVVVECNYYARPEVSNSDLSKLQRMLRGEPAELTIGSGIRMGRIVDALVTEPERANVYACTIDGEHVSEGEMRHGCWLVEQLHAAAKDDPFLALTLKSASTQVVSSNTAMDIDYCGFHFTLPTRCKWDWWFDAPHFGGDLKTTSAATESELDSAIDHFDWDRSRAWYMDIVGSDRDFIYAISTRTGKVMRRMIQRGDPMYERGREKYQYLAFMWWCLFSELKRS